MIHYVVLEHDLLPFDALDSFVRHQVTQEYWTFINGVYRLVSEEAFIDDWDVEALRQRIKALNQIIENQGCVVLAYHEDKIVGFSALPSQKLGSLNDQMELKYCHVSKPYRGQGIGKALFQLSVDIALKSGAQKLYISSHPSKESQIFYTKMGCVLATEIIDEIALNEPYDLQLICDCVAFNLSHL
jgi:N-acetylglutamate synthase-like GNAT family acetyltransferase